MKTLIQSGITIQKSGRKIILLIAFVIINLLPLTAQLDFIYDSVLYKTMYPHYLREYLKNHPEAVIFDVRSPGEYADTSRYKTLNFGHLKGAINMPKDSIQKSLGIIEKYKNTPVIVYCSHSSRSRRASKQLSENGFKQVINLNGGMSWMSQASESEFPGRNEMIISMLPYKNLSIHDAITLLKGNRLVTILDVRKKTIYEGRDSVENLNVGRLKRAINLPVDELKDRFSGLLPDKNTEILIYDDNGRVSHIAAKFLIDQGYKKINNMIGGIADFIDKSSSSEMNIYLENRPAYSILNYKQTVELLSKNSSTLILDLRPQEEFQNKSKEVWKNRGSIKNAKNLPPGNPEEQIKSLSNDKQNTILVYGGSDPAGFCKLLVENGFKKVNLLYGGIYSLIYAYANIEGYRNVKSLLANYEGLY